MNHTLLPALTAGAGCLVVDAVYARSALDLNVDALFELEVARYVYETYCETNTPVPLPLISWLQEGDHTQALHLIHLYGSAEER